MYERRPSMNSPRPNEMFTRPTKSLPNTPNPDYSPTISRYGRSHKPKMQEDYVSTDKKVSAYLKLSPGNQMKYYSISKEPKKKPSPKKITPEGAVKRGRPPKPKTPMKDCIEGIASLNTTIKVEPQDPHLAVDGCEWMVGDLAWARVGGHPFWPCIIALDPAHKIFTKRVLRGRNSSGQQWVHVQFYGDNGRRSWLNISAIMAFNGRDAFIQLGETILAGMRKKDPKQTSAFIIKPAVLQVWEKAVQEAEDMVNATREERIAFFDTHFPAPIPQPWSREELITKALENSESPPKKRGRKRKAEAIPVEDQVKIKQIKLEKEEVEVPVPEVVVKMEVKEEPKEKPETQPTHSLLSSTPRTIADRKKRQALLIQMARSNQMAAADAAAGDVSRLETPAPELPTPSSNESSFAESTPVEKKKPKKFSKKNIDADFQIFCARNFEKVFDEHPGLNEKGINKYLQKLWNDMDKSAKSSYSRSGLTPIEKRKPKKKGVKKNADEEFHNGNFEKVYDQYSGQNEKEIKKHVHNLLNDTYESAKSRSSFNESTPVEKKKTKKKYVKKNIDADFQNYRSKNFEKVSDEHPELNEKEVNKHLQKLWNDMDENARAKHRGRSLCATSKEEESEPSEEVDEDTEVERQSSKSSSPAPQKPATIKRSCKNLFSGAKAEKVCQICERAGETVRCRGPCQGFYHPNCVTNPPTPVVAPPGRKGGKKRRFKKNADSPAQVGIRTPSQDEESKNIPVEVATPETPVEKIVKIEEVVESEGNGSAKVRKGSKDSLSGEEDEEFRCKDCSEGRSQPCFVCHLYVHNRTGEAKLYRCVTAKCGKVYHEECLKAWPQTQWRGNDRGVLTCPQHTCHTCISDNPAVIKARYSNDKLVRCVRCPSSYHYGNYCLPAGSEILTNSQIVCPQHYAPPRKGIINHVNAAWCFICASGGSLICCDLCPTAFHADCLNISTPPDTYVCEDCQTGRFPLYGEIVWVKLGVYRWWPAEILYPSMIPDNILNLPHVRGEFAVRFFGSHDHYWVNRGRVFLYQDGDTWKPNYKKSSVDQMFEKAVNEASEAQRKYLIEKATRDAETRPGMKPPNYVKLKTNKPVGNVRTIELNMSNLSPCECDPKSDHPCAPDSDCLNRILMVECNPAVCPAGEKCHNQLFEKRQYPPLQPYQTAQRGWGLKTLVPLKKGDFVIEYVGEMIDEEEYKRRLVEMHERNEDNFYFLTIDKDRMLDAGPKGNVARFMNHSCQPNCETQKWTVNGDTRVGLFALCDVPADTELVFNYNLESVGNDKKACMCGAPNCSGFIGVKAIKQEKEENKEKKVVKKKKASKAREQKCFMCGKEGGDLVRCDGKRCTKGYHLTCVGKKQMPQGYWLCPWHQCNVCNKGRVRRCAVCVNSFCQEHAEGNIHEDPDSKHLLCNQHNQDTTISNTNLLESKDASLVMEVDGELSDNSATSSSNSDSKESMNNNVLKTPRPRTRRSNSYAALGNVPVIRRKRPSSVDQQLIVSYEKTEPKIKKIRKLQDKIFTPSCIAREIINEVIDNLPEQNNESEASERSEKGTETVTETNEEISNNTSLNEDLVEMEEKKLEKKSTDEPTYENIGLDTSDKESVLENRSELEKRQYMNIEDQLSKMEGLNNTEYINWSDVKPDVHKHVGETIEEVQELEAADNDGNLRDTKPKTESVGHKDNEFETNLKSEVIDKGIDATNNLNNSKSDVEFSQSEITKLSTHNGIVNNEKEKTQGLPTSCAEELDEKEGKKHELLNSANNLDFDAHIDDFELTYSESSNDNVYKNVNSESSIEMKLTNCGTTEDEMNGPMELVNGIDKSSVMEVA